MDDFIFNNFEWNIEKAEKNFKNHKVSFGEATTIFDDPFFVVFTDPDHSFEEQRFIIIGNSKTNRFLFVSYTERENIRIISARELTSKERKDYENKRPK